MQITGQQHFPAAGPVVVAANHSGFIDGPLMAIMAPRPLHALTKREMFAGAMGPFLRQSGQIPLWREAVDPLAVRTALRVLRDGGCVGVFPEGTRGAGELLTTEGGAAYLALVTGAPVLPLVYLGTREPGGSTNSIPPKGTRVVMQYGAAGAPGPAAVATPPGRRTTQRRAGPPGAEGPAGRGRAAHRHDHPGSAPGPEP